MSCLNCARSMVPHTAWEAGMRGNADTYHKARGLCVSCYSRWKRAQLPARPSRPRRPPSPIIPADDLLTEYAVIRPSCQSIREAADRMGVTFARLDRALYRARRRGDRRGLAPWPQRQKAIDRGNPFTDDRTHAA